MFPMGSYRGLCQYVRKLQIKQQNTPFRLNWFMKTNQNFKLNKNTITKVEVHFLFVY